ncbi:hypothetical protein AVEN_269831-1 [Araneus ventricosus]|uniref:Uncharacterized protein n=1 Tax=Araneus ventricosus TaxID=182803 RepID=A0A4Y2CEQ9_ARAVE|nr:hypothetical protein AVEN_269831-1 [Araneus ventricosus]
MYDRYRVRCDNGITKIAGHNVMTNTCRNVILEHLLKEYPADSLRRCHIGNRYGTSKSSPTMPTQTMLKCCSALCCLGAQVISYNVNPNDAEVLYCTCLGAQVIFYNANPNDAEVL